MGGAIGQVTGDIPREFGFLEKTGAVEAGEGLLSLGRGRSKIDTSRISALGDRQVSPEIEQLAKRGLTVAEEENLERQLSEIRKGETQATKGIESLATEQAKARGFTGSIEDITKEAGIQAGLPSFRAQEEAGILGTGGALQRQGLFAGLQQEGQAIGRQAQIEELLSQIRSGQQKLRLGSLASAGRLFGKTQIQDPSSGGFGQAVGGIFTQKFLGG